MTQAHRPKSHEVEEKILEAAEAAFAQKGFHRATIAEIAALAELGEATIYNYFKNKEELLFRIPVERTREAVRLLDNHLEGIKGALNKLRKLIWFFFHYWESHPNFSFIIQLMWRVNKNYFHMDPQDWRHKLIGYIPAIIEEGQKEGVIDPNLSVRLCRDLILGIMEGTLTRWLLRRSEWSLTANADAVADIVIRAIKTQPMESRVINFSIKEMKVFIGKRGKNDEHKS